MVRAGGGQRPTCGVACPPPLEGHAPPHGKAACKCTLEYSMHMHSGGQCLVGKMACTVASVVQLASVAVPAPAAAAEGKEMLARGGQQQDERCSVASQACGRGRRTSA